MTKKNIQLLTLGFVIFLFMNCQVKEKSKQMFEESISKNLDKSVGFIKIAVDTAYQADWIPRGMHEDGSVKFCGKNFDWTEGFFPGICWDLYSYTKDE